MSIDVRRVSDELKRALRKGVGARLNPQDTDIALTALRAIAASAEQRDLKNRELPFQIELLDEQGWPVETLATIADGAIARATFAAAVRQQPERKIRLRLGSSVLADSQTAGRSRESIADDRG
jgi:hypothetical protein